MITLDEARVLVQVAESKTLAQAARHLRKSPSAVVYSLASIEEKLGIVLLDRSGYRTQVNAAGLQLVEGCRELLGAEQRIQVLSASLKGGWESDLRVVIDGIVPLGPLLRGVRDVERAQNKLSAPATRFHLRTEFLGDVERVFGELRADFMVSVVPSPKGAAESLELPTIESVLVAHRDHAAAKGSSMLKRAQLKREALLTVRGSDPRLHTPTTGLEAEARFILGDFRAKHDALLAGLGYGWMPRDLVAGDLASGRLKVVRWEGASTHLFRPRLYFRDRASLGRAATRFVESLARIPARA